MLNGSKIAAGATDAVVGVFEDGVGAGVGRRSFDLDATNLFGIEYLLVFILLLDAGPELALRFIGFILHDSTSSTHSGLSNGNGSSTIDMDSTRSPSRPTRQLGGPHDEVGSEFVLVRFVRNSLGAIIVGGHEGLSLPRVVVFHACDLHRAVVKHLFVAEVARLCEISVRERVYG